MRKKIDFTGQRFGRLAVLSEAAPKYYADGRPHRQWFCHCDCGKEKVVDQRSLSNTSSCGCVKKYKDLTNQRFGRLTALHRIPTGDWLCKCDCGNEKIVSRRGLTSGDTRSCGCIRNEMCKKSVRDENVFQWHDGTAITLLNNGLRRDNKSGIRGVCKVKGRWQANLTLRGKHMYLGNYDTLEEAAEARKAAEEKYFKPVIEAYENNHSI